MLTAEVIIHKVQGDAVSMVFDLLGESVSQPCKPAHGHPHGEVVALDVAGRYVCYIGIAFDAALADTCAFSGGCTVCPTIRRLPSRRASPVGRNPRHRQMHPPPLPDMPCDRR